MRISDQDLLPAAVAKRVSAFPLLAAPIALTQLVRSSLERVVVRGSRLKETLASDRGLPLLADLLDWNDVKDGLLIVSAQEADGGTTSMQTVAASFASKGIRTVSFEAAGGYNTGQIRDARRRAGEETRLRVVWLSNDVTHPSALDSFGGRSWAALADALLVEAVPRLERSLGAVLRSIDLHPDLSVSDVMPSATRLSTVERILSHESLSAIAARPDRHDPVLVAVVEAHLRSLASRSGWASRARGGAARLHEQDLVPLREAIARWSSWRLGGSVLLDQGFDIDEARGDDPVRDDDRSVLVMTGDFYYGREAEPHDDEFVRVASTILARSSEIDDRKLIMTFDAEMGGGLLSGMLDRHPDRAPFVERLLSRRGVAVLSVEPLSKASEFSKAFATRFFLLRGLSETTDRTIVERYEHDLGAFARVLSPEDRWTPGLGLLTRSGSDRMDVICRTL